MLHALASPVEQGQEGHSDPEEQAHGEQARSVIDRRQRLGRSVHAGTVHEDEVGAWVRGCVQRVAATSGFDGVVPTVVVVVKVATHRPKAVRVAVGKTVSVRVLGVGEGDLHLKDAAIADLGGNDAVGGGTAHVAIVQHHAHDATVGAVERQARWEGRHDGPGLEVCVNDHGIEAHGVTKDDHASAVLCDVGVGKLGLDERVARPVTVDVDRDRRGVERVRRTREFLLRGIAVAVWVRFQRIAQSVAVGVHGHVVRIGRICTAGKFLGVVPRIGVSVDEQRVRARVFGAKENARVGFQHVKQSVVVVVKVLDEHSKVVIWEFVWHAVVVGVKQHGDGQVPWDRHAGGVGPHRPRHRFRRRGRRTSDAPQHGVEHEAIGQVRLNRPNIHAAIEQEGLPRGHCVVGDEHEALLVEQPWRLADDLEAEGGRGRPTAVVGPDRVGAVAPDLFGHAPHRAVGGAEEQALRQWVTQHPRGDVARSYEGCMERHLRAGFHHHEGQMLRRVGERWHLIHHREGHRRRGRATAVVRPHRVGGDRPQFGRRAPERAVLGAELHAEGQGLVDGPRGDQARSGHDRCKRQVRMRRVLNQVKHVRHIGHVRQLVEHRERQRCRTRTTAVVRPHRVGCRWPKFGRDTPKRAVGRLKGQAFRQFTLEDPRRDFTRTGQHRVQRQISVRGVVGQHDHVRNIAEGGQLVHH